MLRFGTKWPSITSTWMRSAPAGIDLADRSPSREKSADRMEGAIMANRSSRCWCSEFGVTEHSWLSEFSRARGTGPEEPAETAKHQPLEHRTPNTDNLSAWLTASPSPASCSRSPAGPPQLARPAPGTRSILDSHARHPAGGCGRAASVPRAVVLGRRGDRAGLLLQWIGHRVEGNDVGEFIPVKRLLGLPVVAIAPRSGAPEAKPHRYRHARLPPDARFAASSQT